MRDILYTAATSEPREKLIARLSKPTELLWNIAPKSAIRHMYLVHRSEIIGWLLVVAQFAIGDEPLMARRHDTGDVIAIRNTRNLVTCGPIHLIGNPDLHPHVGFRSFRYFDMREDIERRICNHFAMKT